MGRFFIFWVGGIVLLNDVKVFIVVLIRVFLVFDRDELIFLFIVINKLKRFYFIIYFMYFYYICVYDYVYWKRWLVYFRVFIYFG